MVPAEILAAAVPVLSYRCAQPFRLFDELVASHDIEIFVHAITFPGSRCQASRTHE